MRTVLHTESSPGLGGQEIRTLRELGWTRERGWRVLLACQAGGALEARARAQGLETAPLRMRGAWDPLAIRRLVGLIRRERVDVVHTHSSVDAWLAGTAARLARVPVVRTRHVSIPIRRGWNAVYTRLADRVITSGEAIRALVVGAGVPAERVVAIPAGVDIEEFRPRPRAGELAAALGLTRPVVGSVAMFRGSKGHAHLIDAFRLVRERVPSATLLLVGEGIRRGWVEELAVARGVREAVVFTGLREDVPALLSVMDCFVQASTRTEGVPQSLLQAFAATVPVVATAVGGIPEIVADGITGVLVKAEDPRWLAEAIGAVLADPEAARARAGAGRRLVVERFSHAVSMERLLALYEEVLGGAPTRAGGVR
jgi:glycosyltransferase involved in cell wall biosynthesis